MKVDVQFYAQLRDIVGISKMDFDLREGATVYDLLKEIYELKPSLRAHDPSLLVGAGVEFVQRGHVLSEGEVIAIMPPVQGG
jgi:molybdopterin converting factor small subunit